MCVCASHIQIQFYSVVMVYLINKQTNNKKYYIVNLLFYFWLTLHLLTEENTSLTRQDKNLLSLSNITHCNKSTNLFESLYFYSFKSSLTFLMHVTESEQILIKIVKNHFPLERVIIHNLEKKKKYGNIGTK